MRPLPIILAALKFSLPFLLQNSIYELHRDEYLYLAEGNHLAWGFMEVPPLLSLFSKLSLLAGGGFFWVKFWPAFFGAMTVLVVCALVREMGGKVFAQFIAALCISTGVYLRVHFLFQPTILEIFFWSVIAYCIVRYVKTEKNQWLLYTGVAIGLAWLSKYSILFFVAGIGVGLLLTPHRKLFLNRYLYLALVIALLIALPNIIWQYQHRWPVITHMQELRETQLQFVSPFDFLKDQLLMHLPYCFVWIGGVAWLFFTQAGRPYRLLGWMYLTVIILLIASSGKSYYSLGAYSMLIAAGAVWLERTTSTRLKWLRYASPPLVVILSLPLLPLALPMWKPEPLSAFYQRYEFRKLGVLRWEDLQDHPLPQDFSDMLGWKEMAAKVSRVYASLPDSVKSKTMIHCRNYGQAGAVTYYGRGLPQVNTDNASFLFWMPDTYQVNNILLVAGKLPKPDDIVFQQFESYRVLDSIENSFSREFGTRIILYQNGNNKLNDLIEASVKEQKDEFRQ